MPGELVERWFDADLREDRSRARSILRRFNAPNCSEVDRCLALIELFGEVRGNIVVLPEFQCHFGYNIKIGRGVFVNRNCVFLDAAEIHIGDGVQIFPEVQINTSADRVKPVKIGDHAIIGGGAIIMPGVTIGADAIIAARCIIRRDVPEGALVNPEQCLV